MNKFLKIFFTMAQLKKIYIRKQYLYIIETKTSQKIIYLLEICTLILSTLLVHFFLKSWSQFNILVLKLTNGDNLLFETY